MLSRLFLGTLFVCLSSQAQADGPSFSEWFASIGGLGAVYTGIEISVDSYKDLDSNWNQKELAEALRKPTPLNYYQRKRLEGAQIKVHVAGEGPRSFDFEFGSPKNIELFDEVRVQAIQEQKYKINGVRNRRTRARGRLGAVFALGGLVVHLIGTNELIDSLKKPPAIEYSEVEITEVAD